MCDECRAFSEAASGSLIELPRTAQAREQIARRLSVDDGVCPDTLVANTLDEEPVDGLLASGEDAHYSWRNLLFRADRLYSAVAHH